MKGKRKLSFKTGAPIVADAVIMATGIRTNLEWLKDSGLETGAGRAGGIVVDDHLRSSVKNVYAAGDVARGRNLVTGAAEVHAIEPTAQEHGRVVGANMAGRDVAYRGSLLMNIVEVCHLDVASFGQWDGKGPDVFTGIRARALAVPQAPLPRRPAHRRHDLRGPRTTSGPPTTWAFSRAWSRPARICPRGRRISPRDPFDVKPAFMATRTTAALLPRDHPRPAFPFTLASPIGGHTMSPTATATAHREDDHARAGPHRRLRRQAAPREPLHREDLDPALDA